MREILKNLFKKILDKPLTMYIIVAVIITAFIIILIISLYKYRRNEKNIKLKETQENNVQRLLVDMMNNNVRRFNKLTVSHPNLSTLHDFLRQFEGKNQEKISNWLLDLLNPKLHTSKVLIITNHSQLYKSFVNHVFIARSINDSKKIIHIDLFCYSLRTNKEQSCPYIRSESEFERIFYSAKRSDTYTFGLLTFYETCANLTDAKYTLDPLAYYQILDLIIRRLDSSHLVCILKNGSILFILPKHKIEHDNFLEQIKHDIKIFYQIDDLKCQSFCICVTNVKSHRFNFLETVNKLSVYTSSLVDNLEKDEHFIVYGHEIIYQKNQKTNTYHFKKVTKDHLDEDDKNKPLEDLKLFQNKIDYIIKNKLFSYDTTAVISAQTGEVDSYYCEILPLEDEYISFDTFIKGTVTFNLGKDYISAISNLISDIFQGVGTTSKKVITICIKSSILLLKDVDSMAEEIGKLTNDKINKFNLVLSFSQNEIVQSPYQKEIFDLFENIKKHGIQCRLNIERLDYLDSLTINTFDSFSIDKNFFAKIDNNYIQLVRLRNILEIINKNKYATLINTDKDKITNFKTVIKCYTYNIDSWDIVDILVFSKILYIHSPLFEVESTINPTVPEKTSHTLKELYTKYY